MSPLGHRLRDIPDPDSKDDKKDLDRWLKERGHTRGIKPTKRGQHRVEWLHMIDVQDMLEELDVLNISKATADEWLFSCPFPGHSSGDSKPSAYMNDGSKDKTKATVWKCHGCGRSGNAISFVAEHEDLSRREAQQFLKKRYAEGFTPIHEDTLRAHWLKRMHEREEDFAGPKPMPRIDWDKYNDLFCVDWRTAHGETLADDPDPAVVYLFNRGFDSEALERYSIGYDRRQERFTIPIATADNELVGVKGRAWRPDAQIKYLAIGDKEESKRKRYGFAPYEKSRIVFGLNVLPYESALREGFEDALVLVEGELDVIALWMMGIPAVCTGSAHLSAEQARQIRNACEEIIVFYDSDTAGEQATWGWEAKDGRWHPGLVEALSPFLRVKIVDDHEMDAADHLKEDRREELVALLQAAVPWTRAMVE
jgi:hypothetical protein